MSTEEGNLLIIVKKTQGFGVKAQLEQGNMHTYLVLIDNESFEKALACLTSKCDIITEVEMVICPISF